MKPIDAKKLSKDFDNLIKAAKPIIDSGIFYSVRLNFQGDFGKTIAFCAKDLGFVESIDKNGFIEYEKDPIYITLT